MHLSTLIVCFPLYEGLCSDITKKESFTFYEKWRSREDLDLHFGEPHFKEFAEKVPELIIGEPSLVSYEIASETEISQ